MESDDTVELISLAVQKLIEENKKKKDASSHDDQLLLSNLLSQVAVTNFKPLYRLFFIHFPHQSYERKKK